MCEMGRQLKIENDKIEFKDRLMDIPTFFYYLSQMVENGCNLTFVRALSGFTFTDANGMFYVLKLSDYEIDDYEVGIYSPVTKQLHDLVLLQDKNKTRSKTKYKKLF